jgi:hypothetical protein
MDYLRAENRIIEQKTAHVCGCIIVDSEKASVLRQDSTYLDVAEGGDFPLGCLLSPPAIHIQAGDQFGR